MSAFAGIEQAQTSGGGVYFLDGIYVVDVKSVKMHKGRDRIDNFIVEATIVESNNPQRAAGMTCSQVIKMSQDAALGSIKAFVAAASGLDLNNPEHKLIADQQVNAALCEVIVSPAQPLAGVRLRLQCTTVKTRAGGDFTQHRWSPFVAA